MKKILMAFMFVIATIAPANAITLWYDHETNTKVIELQPGESANEELHCMAHFMLLQENVDHFCSYKLY